MLSIKYQKTLLTINLILLVICCLVFSVKSLGPDELYFLHHAWANNYNVGISTFEVYPFPLVINLLSLIYKHLGLTVFIAWKPAFSILYLLACYLLIKNKKNKWFYAYLLTILILNRAVEIRPEPLATLTILFSFLISDKSTNNWANISKLTLIMAAVTLSPRYFPIVGILIAHNLYINKGNKKIWFWNFGISLIIITAAYTLLIGNPINTIQHLFSREDLRENFSLKYKLDRLFGNGYLLQTAIFYFLTQSIVKIIKKNAEAVDIHFTIGLTIQILFIVIFDKVPYEYVSQAVILLVIWYHHNRNTESNFSFDSHHNKISFTIFFIILLATTIEIKKNRDVFKIYLANAHATFLNSPEQLLLTKNLTPSQQITSREIFCKKYSNYYAFTNNYSFHPVCMPDEYSIKIGRLLMTEGDIDAIIQKKEGVIQLTAGINKIYLYPTK